MAVGSNVFATGAPFADTTTVNYSGSVSFSFLVESSTMLPTSSPVQTDNPTFYPFYPTLSPTASSSLSPSTVLPNNTVEVLPFDP